MTSPASVPAHLLALDEPAPAQPQALPGARPPRTRRGDSALRSAIVNVARHYLRMAQTRTPAEMESLIWQASSVDGADHGQSCAAFASLTLALGAKAAGQQSWVTGGGSYPWPLHAVGRRPRPAQPGLAGRGVDARRRAGPSPLAPARRRLPAAAGRLGAVRRARRGGHQVQRRRAVHGRRRLAAGPDGERAQVPGSVRRPGRARIRQQRRPGQRGRRQPGRRPGPRHRLRLRAWPRLRRGTSPPADGAGGGHAARAGRPRSRAAGTPRAASCARLPTAGTISRRRAGRGPRPSRRSSAWWRRGRSRRSSGTASRPR